PFIHELSTCTALCSASLNGLRGEAISVPNGKDGRKSLAGEQARKIWKVAWPEETAGNACARDTPAAANKSTRLQRAQPPIERNAAVRDPGYRIATEAFRVACAA